MYGAPLLAAADEPDPRAPAGRRRLGPLRGGSEANVKFYGACVFFFFAALTMSISSLAPNQYGILRNTISGALAGEDVYHGGILFTGPIYEFLPFPAAQITLDFTHMDPAHKPIEAWTGKDQDEKALELGSSGQPIKISCAVQFRFQQDNLKTVYTKFGGVTGAMDRYRIFVRNAVSTASQRWPPTSFWEQRMAITDDMLQEINATLWKDGYVTAHGFEIIEINFAEKFEHMIIQNQVNEQRQTTNLYDQQVAKVVQGTEVLRQRNLAAIANISAEAHAEARRIKADASSYGFNVAQEKKAEKYSQLRNVLGFDSQLMRQYFKLKAMESQRDGAQVTVGVPGVVGPLTPGKDEL